MIVNLITSEKIADDLGLMFGIYLCVLKQFVKAYAQSHIHLKAYTMYVQHYTMYMNNVWKIKI
jgi:hypothetical protein